MTDDTFASFSGGRSSAVMVAEMIRRGKPPRAVIFNNTSMETPATLDFVFAFEREVLKPAGVPFHAIEFCVVDGSRHWKPINEKTCSRKGEAFLDFIKLGKFIPGPQFRQCTSSLKVETSGKFIRDHYGLRHYTTAVGFRACEKKRVAKMRERNTAYERLVNEGKLPPVGASYKIAPLNEWGIDKEAVTKEISAWGDWAAIAKTDARLSNCAGCFMGGEIGYAAKVVLEFPELARVWLEAENWVQDFKNGQPHLKIKEYPVALYKTQKDALGTPPDPRLRTRWTAKDRWSWMQAFELAEQIKAGKVGSLQLPVEEPTGGCMDGYCGTD